MKGSEKGDMYSFAIVTQELILRMSPFGMVDLKREGMHVNPVTGIDFFLNRIC